MGLEDTYNVFSKLTVTRLVSDGLNWMSYQKCITNAITSRKLCQHVVGTVQKPALLVESNGFFFIEDKSKTPLSGKEVEEHKDNIKDWLQKEAIVHDILYAIIDQSTFHQIRGELNAAAVWKKLASIHSNRGTMFKTYLAWLQNSRFIENSGVSMYDHLANLVILKECLAKINCPLSDASFASINQHHEAMIAAHTKAKGKSKDIKKKSKSKGGGMAGKAPDWWVKKHKGKGKDMARSANTAETEDKSNNNYMFLTYILIDAPNNTTNEDVAFAITSGHSHEPAS
ncbi:hypothetical protein C0989_005465 [Termitomyces sp. Mn162]|nr:hypothetical protein C0989_005465 [Termitomyces sp. Mn162]